MFFLRIPIMGGFTSVFFGQDDQSMYDASSRTTAERLYLKLSGWVVFFSFLTNRVPSKISQRANCSPSRCVLVQHKRLDQLTSFDLARLREAEPGKHPSLNADFCDAKACIPEEPSRTDLG